MNIPGRNEPCPCGSGKKYKNCCSKAGEVISIQHLIHKELDLLQREIVEYGIRYYSDRFENSFEAFIESLDEELEEEEYQFYFFLHSIWVTLFDKRPFTNGKTIIQDFIAASKIKRPKVKQILETWHEPVIVAGTLIDFNEDKGTIEDKLTGELFNVNFRDYKLVSSESYFFGMLVPVDGDYIFYPLPVELEDVSIEDITEYLQEDYQISEFETVQQYYKEHFMDILYTLPRVGLKVEMDELDWDEPNLREVAEIFKKKMEETGQTKRHIDLGITTWFVYCKEKQKRIKNPVNYAAALHHFIMDHYSDGLKQKDIAHLYGVKPSAMSPISLDLRFFVQNHLEDEWEDDINDDYFDFDDIDDSNPFRSFATEKAIKEAVTLLQDKEFNSMDEVNQFLNQSNQIPLVRNGNLSDQEQAEELLYEAWEAKGKERYRLAKKALEIYPYLADAYNILAEEAKTAEEALKIYEKALLIGEDQLGGEEYFRENMGHFWGLIETRPYIRAKINIAHILLSLNRNKEAIQHFEEILELNEMDNQGIRYCLFPIYMEELQYKKAQKLLKQFPEDTTHGIYNKLLLELAVNGMTAKAKKLMKEAVKVNPHVIPYLKGTKKLPKQEPSYYSWGDENEAIVYLSSSLPSWNKLIGSKIW